MKKLLQLLAALTILTFVTACDSKTSSHTVIDDPITDIPIVDGGGGTEENTLYTKAGDINITINTVNHPFIARESTLNPESFFSISPKYYYYSADNSVHQIGLTGFTELVDHPDNNNTLTFGISANPTISETQLETGGTFVVAVVYTVDGLDYTNFATNITVTDSYAITDGKHISGSIENVTLEAQDGSGQTVTGTIEFSSNFYKITTD